MKNSKEISSRIWEIDAVRGLAIVAMVMYHIYFSLEYFYGVEFDQIVLRFFDVIGWFARLTFVMLVGATIWIRFVKAGQKITQQLLKKTLKRSGIIGLAALLVSLSTWYAYGQSAIWFGVLHLIALSLILAIPFLSRPKVAGVVGIIIAATGFRYFPIPVPFNHLFILGFVKPPRFDFDFFPLIPWFGVVLIGILLTSEIYKNNLETKFSTTTNLVLKKYLTTWGKYSLLIYLVHQPIILMLLKLITL